MIGVVAVVVAVALLDMIYSTGWWGDIHYAIIFNSIYTRGMGYNTFTPFTVIYTGGV